MVAIVNVDVSLLEAPAPKKPWYMTVREFGLRGGFRGVQARADELGVIAVVLIEDSDENIPRFRRNGSPWTQIIGFYVGNIHPADREETLRSIFEPNFSARRQREYMFAGASR